MSATNPDYWERVRNEAGRLGSDGCSMALGTYVDCCYEHDIAYRTGATVDGVCLTKEEADARFRSCIQSHSIFGWYSPVAWVRFGILKWRGQKAWDANAAIRADEKQRREAIVEDVETDDDAA